VGGAQRCWLRRRGTGRAESENDAVDVMWSDVLYMYGSISWSAGAASCMYVGTRDGWRAGGFGLCAHCGWLARKCWGRGCRFCAAGTCGQGLLGAIPPEVAGRAAAITSALGRGWFLFRDGVDNGGWECSSPFVLQINGILS
jgi:hypothetical protein